MSDSFGVDVPWRGVDSPEIPMLRQLIALPAVDERDTLSARMRAAMVAKHAPGERAALHLVGEFASHRCELERAQHRPHDHA